MAESTINLSEARQRAEALVMASRAVEPAPEPEAVDATPVAAVAQAAEAAVEAPARISVDIPDAGGEARETEKEIARIVALKKENSSLAEKMKELQRVQLEMEQFEEKRKKYEAEKMMIQQDPVSFIKNAGWNADTIEAVAKMLRTGQSQPDVVADSSLRATKALQEKIDALEKRLVDFSDNAAKRDALTELAKIVGNTDEFEIIRENKLYDNVLQTQKEYAKLGEDISLEQAARLVESQFEQQLTRLLSLKKASKLLGQNSAAPAPAAKTTPSIKHQAPAVASAREPVTLEELRERIHASMTK